MTKAQRTIKDVQAELDKAKEWTTLLGKVNRQLMEYIMEKMSKP